MAARREELVKIIAALQHAKDKKHRVLCPAEEGELRDFSKDTLDITRHTNMAIQHAYNATSRTRTKSPYTTH